MVPGGEPCGNRPEPLGNRRGTARNRRGTARNRAWNCSEPCVELWNQRRELGVARGTVVDIPAGEDRAELPEGWREGLWVSAESSRAREGLGLVVPAGDAL